MSEKNPNIERAAKVIEDYFASAPPLTELKYADALDAAGLIVTPLHEKALRACERMAKVWPDGDELKGPVGPECWSVGRASLALKEKAKGARYEVEVGLVGAGVFTKIGDRKIVVACGAPGLILTEQQARRVAAALNEGDE